MPGGDGTGPLGQGPMTGRGEGFCILRSDEQDPLVLKGFAGIHGVPVDAKFSKGNTKNSNNRKEAAMPRGDGTGPMGMGPMTGRAAGFCAGYGMPGYMNPVAGRGFRLRQGYGGQVGMGFGRGRGFGGGGGRGWGTPYGVPAYGYGAAYGGIPVAPYGTPYATPYANAPTKEQELDMLKGQAEQFETTLGDIRKRLQELETEKAAV